MGRGGTTVSVVVPTHDRAEGLAVAVASALAQEPPPAEVIVVDDGSATPAAAPAGVRLLRLDRAEGPAGARNRGAATATGDVLAFLDDDDEWRPGLLATLVAALEESGADAVACGWDLVDHLDGREVVLARVAPPPADDLGAALLADPTLVPSCLLVRAEAFRAVGGFDPALRYGEDWDLTVRLVGDHRIVTVADRLVRRRAHADARYGRRLVTDHLAMQRRLRPALAAADPPVARHARRRHRRRLLQYAARLALEPVLVGRAPWRARHRRRLRRAAGRP